MRDQNGVLWRSPRLFLWNASANASSCSERSPDEVVVQQAGAQPQRIQHVGADLSQQLAVFLRGLWVGVTTFVCAELQQHCRRGKKRQVRAWKPSE